MDNADVSLIGILGVGSLLVGISFGSLVGENVNEYKITAQCAKTGYSKLGNGVTIKCEVVKEAAK